MQLRDQLGQRAHRTRALHARTAAHAVVVVVLVAVAAVTAAAAGIAATAGCDVRAQAGTLHGALPRMARRLGSRIRIDSQLASRRRRLGQGLPHAGGAAHMREVALEDSEGGGRWLDSNEAAAPVGAVAGEREETDVGTHVHDCRLPRGRERDARLEVGTAHEDLFVEELRLGPTQVLERQPVAVLDEPGGR
eukprot:scaffold8311_cov71-Phaeocystis_antarctica.AAC.3